MYRDITIGDTNYRANLGILNDHRITIKDGVVSVSADLESRTPEAEFEATFTGRGNISIITAPKNADDIDASEERAEEYVIGDAVFEPGDDVKIAKAAKLFEIAAARYAEEMNGLDVGIFHLATDDRSKMLLSGAYNNARGNSEFTAKWKDS
ncbi:MAG: hypothetical protein LBU13_05385, partial [Synergistaceae bacterium]|nr:hypothetical protein [Synergistaceae bacterium]